MDILHLVDRLEEIVNTGKAVPLTRNVIVDTTALMDIIDQMRISIPEEIKKAQQITAQKDRILAQAQEEANRTVALAREKSEKLIEKSEVYQAAQAKVDMITDKASKEASQSMMDADRYVIDTLSALEQELNKVLAQVRNGIAALSPDDK
ncbi:MAG TPA: hypothetical protein PKI51_02770 [Anaerolineaceae bacterium]|nr:ATP synthase F0 subunit B [Anaerolineaceae bacterium]HNZ14911.1 hypothetical protein [Anaerolineaceae bacterium]HQL91864.1 hypothetical protein [Anaerolineaceae bacterium]HQN68918.1 hypothetical protein [Anaerolineaceae bacterium]